ncbi:MAG: S-methyl-5-thioribose-1-phosphate isomerase [Candidatus Sericytochromatia bacterium]
MSSPQTDTQPLISLGLKLDRGRLLLLDQQALPAAETWIDATDPYQMIAAIQALKVRGAPLIGVAAGLCLGLYARTADPGKTRAVAARLRAARPTAVNLMWAIDRLLPLADQPEQLYQQAVAIFHEDVELCRSMGQHGADLIADGDGILTHCNTGGLATAGIGTALGVIRTAWEQGKAIHVYVDETRPLLQGGRLTAWELEQLGIPYTLITDSMAAIQMRAGRIQKVFLGADRVAVNGDFANKVGTYSVAVNAHFHGIPFYPVAPYSTIDVHCASGSAIEIEQRSADEVRGAAGSFGSVIWAPATATVDNPAFDYTPVELVTALVSDRGVYTRGDLQAGELEEVGRRS